MLTLPMLYSPTAEELKILRESTLLKNLDMSSLMAIVQAATPYKAGRGGFFFHQGEPATTFFLLVSGRVRLSQIADDGRQVIFHYFGAGEGIGVAVVMTGDNYPVSAEAMTDSFALGWDREASISLMEKYPRLAINSMELIAVRFWELQNRYRELATERVEQRLARAILRLTDAFIWPGHAYPGNAEVVAPGSCRDDRDNSLQCQPYLQRLGAARHSGDRSRTDYSVEQRRAAGCSGRSPLKTFKKASKKPHMSLGRCDLCAGAKTA